MLKQFFLCLLSIALFYACNNESAQDKEMKQSDSTTGNVPGTMAPPAAMLPEFVLFQHWEMGDPKKTEVIVRMYQAWDKGDTADVSSFFGDTTLWDFPDGRRQTTTSNSAGATLRKWRSAYKETSNVPFSLISLRNTDYNQDWVIAWTWNKWRYTDGKKDSMLYCDNWRFENDKVVYLNSLESRPSKKLTQRLNTLIPK